MRVIKNYLNLKEALIRHKLAISTVRFNFNGIRDLLFTIEHINNLDRYAIKIGKYDIADYVIDVNLRGLIGPRWIKGIGEDSEIDLRSITDVDNELAAYVKDAAQYKADVVGQELESSKVNITEEDCNYSKNANVAGPSSSNDDDVADAMYNMLLDSSRAKDEMIQKVIEESEFWKRAKILNPEEFRNEQVQLIKTLIGPKGRVTFVNLSEERKVLTVVDAFGLPMYNSKSTKVSSPNRKSLILPLSLKGELSTQLTDSWNFQYNAERYLHDCFEYIVQSMEAPTHESNQSS